MLQRYLLPACDEAALWPRPRIKAGRFPPSPGARPLGGARLTGAVFLSLAFLRLASDNTAHQR